MIIYIVRDEGEESIIGLYQHHENARKMVVEYLKPMYSSSEWEDMAAHHHFDSMQSFWEAIEASDAYDKYLDMSIQVVNTRD